MGFPYWIWRALPEVCPQYLPGNGYQSLGMVYEKNPDGSDRDVPVGTSNGFNRNDVDRGSPTANHMDHVHISVN